MNRILVLLIAATLAACFSPTFNETTCGVNDACPPGFRCIDGVCRQDGMPTDGPSTVTLTLTRGGAGTGTVTSDPAGIDCGATCAHDFEPGTQITLTATPAAGASFTRWTGGVCSGTEPTCTITLTTDAIVNAEFALVPRTLTVEVGGNGTGMVTSVPLGINCPGACSTTVSHGTSVTLTAAAVSGSVFLGWSGGGCTGIGPCTVVVDDDVTVNASFGLNFSLVVTRTGNGSGAITSNPAGINCGTDCDEIYSAGAMVTLTAIAAANSTFTGWGGSACAGTGTCTVTISQAVAVAADFTLRRHTLTAATAGPGGGTITSSPTGIDCGTDCTEVYDHGTAVTLTANPDGVSLFTGWSGACTGTGSCIVTMDMARSVTATFAQQTAGLNVARAGNGSGTVTSSPAGINCGSDCSETFALGTMVTLTATPTPGTSTFTGWSGGGCSGTGTCVVTFNAATTVTATFGLIQQPLTVMRSGAGTGTVTSSPAGINCGADCMESYDHGTTVMLTATPSAGSRFVQWTGACSGTGTCAVTMSSARTATAEFELVHTLTVTKSGSATGTVTSTPTGISCGNDCTESYDVGTMVSLTATPAAGARFVAWTGACTGTGACMVTMSQTRTVNAEFRSVHVLTVNKAGTGFGTVTSSPAGINCGTDCTETYDQNTMVTLTATAAATPASQDSTFAGWTGGGCSGTGTCTVTMNTALTIVASFSLDPNYAFVTSTTHTGNLGGLAGADAICQMRASAAGLPGNYRAWLSSDTTSVASRLGTASGWIRPDGKPFSLSQADLYQGREIYPLRLTETGVDLGSVYTWSASTMNGMINGGTCSNWTSASSSLTSRNGNTSALGDIWADAFAVNSCSATVHLSCFGIDRAAVMAPLPGVTGRRVFMSTYSFNLAGGIAAADAVCASDAAANGLQGTYRALLATSTASAASRFNANGQFIRVDNAVVAVGNALFTAPFWDTAINVFANGAHSGNAGVATGADSPTAVGTAASTCNNWSGGAGFGTFGRPYDSDVSRAFTSLNAECSGNAAVFCVQL